MTDSRTGKPVVGKTRWRRFWLILAPAFGMVALLVVLVAQGILAVSLAFSGIAFNLTADTLTGTQFVQYGGIVETPNNLGTTGVPGSGPHMSPVVFTDLGSASIANLKQTVCAKFPAWASAILGGTHSLEAVITGGDQAGNPVTAQGLVVGASALNATQAGFGETASIAAGDIAPGTYDQGITIGADLSTTGAAAGRYNHGTGDFLDKSAVPFAGGAAAGQFAQYANNVYISGLKQVGLSTVAGYFKLPNINLGAVLDPGSGTGNCPAPVATPAVP